MCLMKKVIFWGLVRRIVGETCTDIDPAMVLCPSDSSQCCFSDGDGGGLNLVGSVGSRALLSTLVGRKTSYARGKNVAFEVSTGNPYFDWAIEEGGKALLEGYLEEACDCDDSSRLPNILPRPFNDASVESSPSSLQTLEDFDNFILENEPACSCHRFERYGWRLSNSQYYWWSSTTCANYDTGDTCLGICINGKGAYDTCNCDSGWQGVSSSDCTSGCPSNYDTATCVSLPVWSDDNGYISARGDCGSNPTVGDSCTLTCVNGNSESDPPVAICGCHGSWYHVSDLCEKCPYSGTECSSSPRWTNSEGQILATGSCIYTKPGYTCTARCTESSDTAEATCSCSGYWTAAITSTCTIDNNNYYNGGADDEDDGDDDEDDGDDDGGKSKSKIGCFPGRSLARTIDGTNVKISQLSVFDEIATLIDGQISPTIVLGIIPSLPRENAYFIKIETNQGRHLLLSPNHFIKIRGYDKQASLVAPGDELMTVDGMETVSNISLVEDSGLYSPITKHGSLLVNDILVSSFGNGVSNWQQNFYLSIMSTMYTYFPFVLNASPIISFLGSRTFMKLYAATIGI